MPRSYLPPPRGVTTDTGWFRVRLEWLSREMAATGWRDRWRKPTTGLKAVRDQFRWSRTKELAYLAEDARALYDAGVDPASSGGVPLWVTETGNLRAVTPAREVEMVRWAVDNKAGRARIMQRFGVDETLARRIAKSAAELRELSAAPRPAPEPNMSVADTGRWRAASSWVQEQLDQGRPVTTISLARAHPELPAERRQQVIDAGRVQAQLDGYIEGILRLEEEREGRHRTAGGRHRRREG